MNDTFSEKRGFLTIAQNNSKTDYLELAYCQALSIKATQKNASCALLVDSITSSQLQQKHIDIFDYIREFETDESTSDDWKFRNEWKVWWLTPYFETIKVESDILFTTGIDHWWSGLQQKEVVLTTKIRNYEGTVSKCRSYRQLFDENNLPDVYSGLMYFRYGPTSLEFFQTARHIFEHWDLFKTQILKSCRDDYPTTDVVYAIAARIVGIENVTNPALSYPSFVHMKGAINDWDIDADWTKKLYAEMDGTNLTVGFTRQMYPFHYHKKEFAKEVIPHYETILEKK